ncbi:MAG: LysR family transcriptional regulator [Myxococcales bacterium]|nr:LysR family transcriptional regulator [Myxococcales bacterium]
MDWLNFHHLYYFWRIARAGGLAKAAADMRLSHSTLSAQLKALEAELVAALFERRGRRLVLTPLGEQVASYADDIFRLGREVLDLTRGQTSEHGAALRVGVVAHFAHRDRPFRRIAITEIGSSRSERSDVSLRLWMIGSRLASRVSGPPC